MESKICPCNNVVLGRSGRCRLGYQYQLLQVLQGFHLPSQWPQEIVFAHQRRLYLPHSRVALPRCVSAKGGYHYHLILTLLSVWRGWINCLASHNRFGEGARCHPWQTCTKHVAVYFGRVRIQAWFAKLNFTPIILHWRYQIQPGSQENLHDWRSPGYWHWLWQSRWFDYPLCVDWRHFRVQAFERQQSYQGYLLCRRFRWLCISCKIDIDNDCMLSFRNLLESLPRITK